ncbi:MAG: carbohydrate-binding domain-containing protein [Acutalibacteraceae bacterium]|jgi:hypothetical protein
MKRILIGIIAVIGALALTACSAANLRPGSTASTTTGSPGESTAESGSVSTDSPVTTESEHFSDGDLKDVTGETPDATITLSGSTGTLSDTTRGTSGSTVTIASKGIYRVTGSSTNVTILIAEKVESGNVYLILDGVSMTNASAPCIQVDGCDKLVVQCVGDNSLTCTATGLETDGAIYSKDDVTLNGTGSLTVSSKMHGVVCNDDLKITGALKLTVNADSIGLKGNDSLRIGGGTTTVTAGHDGIQCSTSDNTGAFYMQSGTLTVRAGYDAIDTGTDGVEIAGGTLDLTTGSGAFRSTSSTSQKGIKSDGAIQIAGGSVTVESADDALHSATDVTVQDGALTLASGDDGIHADNELTVAGGTLNVTRSYEGLEAYVVNVTGGTSSVVASDDGVNAAGGSDSSSTEAMPGPWSRSSSSGTLNISGGTLYVNAGGDGLDSNGSIYVTGGTVIVEGPTNSGNGALDKGDGGNCVASITGGTVLAIGATGMALNFDTGSQCAALLNLSGSAGTTITVDDGSGFTFTATKNFGCVVYSSPSMTQGNTYTVTAGSSSATADFTSSLYYSAVGGMGGNPGGMGGFGGGRR